MDGCFVNPPHPPVRGRSSQHFSPIPRPPPPRTTRKLRRTSSSGTLRILCWSVGRSLTCEYMSWSPPTPPSSFICIDLASLDSLDRGELIAARHPHVVSHVAAATVRRYNVHAKNLGDTYVHLTNAAIQKTAPGYDAGAGCKWPLRNLKLYLIGKFGLQAPHLTPAHPGAGTPPTHAPTPPHPDQSRLAEYPVEMLLQLCMRCCCGRVLDAALTAALSMHASLLLALLRALPRTRLL